MLANDILAREAAIDLYYEHSAHLHVHRCLAITDIGPAYEVSDDRRKIFKGHPYRVWTPEATHPAAYMCECGSRYCEHIGAVLLHRIAHRGDFSPYDFLLRKAR